jgi:thiamine biosynthesis lipoprotein
MIRVPEPVMGTVVSMTVDAPDLPPERAWLAIAAARACLHRADAVFSLWKPNSPMNRLRRAELRLPDAPKEVGEVLLYCSLAREWTAGWFDPWALPGGVDPTGLVKGWAAGRALDELRKAGVGSALLSAGGDVVTLGHPDHDPGRPWRIGITHPWDPEGLIGVVDVSGDAAVCTSGTYERGAHLLDPTTGAPAARTVSATVIGPDPGLADALATGLAVGGDDALGAIDRLEGYEGWLIRPDGSDAATAGWALASPVRVAA